MTNLIRARAGTRELLRDVEMANDVGRPVGAFSVELRDPVSGKLVDRRRQSNYITPVYERLVRWWQGAMFHAGLPYVSDSTVGDNFPGAIEDLSRPPLFPIEAMLSLDSTLAADTGSDWVTGRTIGYGFRWKATVAASGKRGQINEAQCLALPDSIRLVWDFNENQGNGEFGSLAIARATQAGTILLPPEWPTLRFEQANMPTTPAANYYSSIVGMDATYLYVLYGSASNSVRLCRLPLADFTGDNYPDGGEASYVAGTPTEVVLAGMSFFTNTTTGNTAIYFLSTSAACADGTSYLFAHQDGGRRLYLSRFNSSGTRTHVLTLVGTGSGSGGRTKLGVAVIGGNAYVSSTSDNDAQNTKIYRVDLTSFTVTATLTLDGSATHLGGMTAIGSHLFVSTSEGVQKYLASDGSYVESYGLLEFDGFTEQGQAPFNTSTSPNGYGLNGLGMRDALWLHRGHLGAPTNGDMSSGFYAPYLPQSASVEPPHLFGDGTKLWAGIGNYNATGSQDHANNAGRTLARLRGGNAFSRSVLDSPVTKSTSSTMKWTYELTLPASWRANPTHAAPPS
jgi:hypothetical protein